MRKIFILFAFFISAILANAQTFPKGLPSPSSSGYSKIGYSQADSGFIQIQRDTFNAKYPTIIRYLDGNLWQTLGNGARWSPLKSASIMSLYAGYGLTKINDSTLKVDSTVYLPYQNPRNNVYLDGRQLYTSATTYSTAPTIADSVGRLVWNATDGTLDLGLKGGSVVLQIGQEQVIRVVNKSGTNLTQAGYQAVVLSGTQGQRAKVTLAQANTEAGSANTIGLVTESIAQNQEGYVTTMGLVREINTTGSLQGETWNDSTVLYLSPTVAGGITSIEPTAPNHRVVIGTVIYSHAIHGSIFVNVSNGYELSELHDVAISSPLNNNALFYESSSSLWKNKSLSSVGVITASDTALMLSSRPNLTYVTANLSTKLNISDSILANRVTADRVFLNASLPLKLNISDTASMLSNYYNNTASNSRYQPIENQRLSTTNGVAFNSVTANSLIKSGGTSSQILMGDGSISTVGNGISLSGGVLSLGSSLFSDVSIASSGYQLSFNGGGSVALGNNNIPFRSTSYLVATGTEITQLATTGVYGGLHVDIASGNFTPFSTSKHAALSATTYKTSAGNYLGILPAIFGTIEFMGSGNVTTAASIRAYRPELTSGQTYTGVVTNAVGIYIDDINASSIASQITNKYAIYQAGANDINLFNGIIKMVNLPIYADNTAASSLATGTLYRTATGQLMVKY